MGWLLGALTEADNERAFVGTVGQRLVFDWVTEYLARWNTEVSLSLSVFVERQTENFKIRYLLPGGGKLQRMDSQAAAFAVKRHGYFDVAFPLYHYGAVLAGNRVDMAYMTLGELEAHVDNITMQDLNTMRWRILTSIFEDTNFTFGDDYHGNLTITRLANTDGTAYPPVLGSETEADDDHYSESAYTVAQISDANNPLVTLRDEIAEHFGGLGSTGRNFVYFHANDQLAYLQALADYVACTDRFLQAGASADEVSGWPNVPGRIHGRANGCWLSEWDGWMPDTYGIMILLEVPSPLIMRVDPADTGLPRGLSVVAVDQTHPMQESSFEHRYGFGCGNRLSAAVMEISGGGGTYAPPSAYSE